MSAETTVCRNCRPLVTQDSRVGLAEVHHRLDGDDHSLAQLCSVSAGAIVRNLRLFVQTSSNAVSYELTHYAESGGLDVLLDYGSHVADRIADSCLLNSAVQRTLCHFQKLLKLGLQAVAHRYRDCRISVIAVEHDTAVDRDDVSLFQHSLFRGNAVNDLFIHRRAQHARIIVVALERRLGSEFLNLFLG